ncbi:MAG TPA: EVE domain-containing protein, partial [Thiobacillaceae bacterium]|nr:EVE domain-containing protein [Thiobacillaceae bacterium]
FVKKTRLISIKELRDHPQLANMRILQKGNRLSVTPVDPKEYEFILGLLSTSPKGVAGGKMAQRSKAIP